MEYNGVSGQPVGLVLTLSAQCRSSIRYLPATTVQGSTHHEDSMSSSSLVHAYHLQILSGSNVGLKHHAQPDLHPSPSPCPRLASRPAGTSPGTHPPGADRAAAPCGEAAPFPSRAHRGRHPSELSAVWALCRTGITK